MNSAPHGSGQVYLVGAGPGDPALLTLKAAEVLAAADAVAIDAGLDARLLARCRADAVCRTVGGKGQPQGDLTDAEALDWVIEQALAGKTVCRLVTGMPVRAWAWVAALQAQEIPLEVVPGVASMPLVGKTIVVTRARQQDEPLQVQLEARGARVLSCPAIEIVPPEYPEVIAESLRRIPQYDWVVFTSKNGVEQTMQLLFLEGLDARLFAGVKIATVGPATAEALGRYGLFSDLTPRQFVGEALFGAFQQAGVTVSGRRFLLLRGNIAREDLPDALQAAGAHVEQLTVYRTVEPSQGPETAVLADQLLARQVDMITFGSASAVAHFAKRLSPLLEKDSYLLDRVLLVAIGPVTGDALKEHFGRVDIEAPVHTIEGLVEAITAYYTGENQLTRTR